MCILNILLAKRKYNGPTSEMTIRVHLNLEIIRFALYSLLSLHAFQGYNVVTYLDQSRTDEVKLLLVPLKYGGLQ